MSLSGKQVIELPAGSAIFVMLRFLLGMRRWSGHGIFDGSVGRPRLHLGCRGMRFLTHVAAKLSVIGELSPVTHYEIRFLFRHIEIDQDANENGTSEGLASPPE